MIEQIGKYSIEGVLGKGAMGVVYKGRDPILNRIVAVKTINKSLLDEHDQEMMLGRFRQEAQSAGCLNHPNIVVIYDYGEDDDKAYLAMAYAPGRELKEYFDNNELFALPDIVKIFLQLLDALAFAHENKVVHRDIKPGNIIINDKGHLMIMDFGIARIESSELTQLGTAMGTPSYMSPEQCMGQRVDGRADVFSAGVILYQLLTGEKPFTGSNITSIFHKILKVDPVPPSDLNYQIPSEFDAVIAKCLAKRPIDRYQTATEFAIDIRKAAQPIMKEMVDSESTFVTTDAMPNLVKNDATVLSAESPAPSEKKGTTAALNNNVAPAPVTESVALAPEPIADPTIINNPEQQDHTIIQDIQEVNQTVISPPSPSSSAPIIMAQDGDNGQPVAGNKSLLFAFLAMLLLLLGGGGYYWSQKEAVIPDLAVEQGPQAPVSAKALLNFTTNPVGVKLIINGVEKGLTPINLEVKPNSYDIILRKDGYEDLALVVAVEKEEVANLLLNLISL